MHTPSALALLESLRDKTAAATILDLLANPAGVTAVADSVFSIDDFDAYSASGDHRRARIIARHLPAQNDIAALIGRAGQAGEAAGRPLISVLATVACNLTNEKAIHDHPYATEAVRARIIRAWNRRLGKTYRPLAATAPDWATLAAAVSDPVTPGEESAGIAAFAFGLAPATFPVSGNRGRTAQVVAYMLSKDWQRLDCPEPVPAGVQTRLLATPDSITDTSAIALARANTISETTLAALAAGPLPYPAAHALVITDLPDGLFEQVVDRGGWRRHQRQQLVADAVATCHRRPEWAVREAWQILRDSVWESTALSAAITGFARQPNIPDDIFPALQQLIWSRFTAKGAPEAWRALLGHPRCPPALVAEAASDRQRRSSALISPHVNDQVIAAVFAEANPSELSMLAAYSRRSDVLTRLVSQAGATARNRVFTNPAASLELIGHAPAAVSRWNAGPIGRYYSARFRGDRARWQVALGLLASFDGTAAELADAVDAITGA